MPLWRLSCRSKDSLIHEGLFVAVDLSLERAAGDCGLECLMTFARSSAAADSRVAENYNFSLCKWKSSSCDGISVVLLYSWHMLNF